MFHLDLLISGINLKTGALHDDLMVLQLFRSYAALDESSRIKKAEKVARVLSRYRDLSKSRILDIGSGSGYLGRLMKKKAKRYIGIDFVDERKIRDFDFVQADALRIPFKNGSFDIIVCNHVIEHVTGQKRLLEEISRLLKKDGICYMTCPNRLWPMEPHLKLPFLSYLPKSLADIYVRATGKGKEYDIYPMTYYRFSKKLKKYFNLENHTIEILKNPVYYGFGKIYSVFSVSRYFPRFLLEFLNNFLPNWIVILRKNLTLRHFNKKIKKY